LLSYGYVYNLNFRILGCNTAAATYVEAEVMGRIYARVQAKV